ncbi:UNVERIFIED_ORG: hypothetical protein GGI57_006361 [Rhizobium aethiopicum]|uniref:hypothetical protein n=1 Tax=Rhizobium TaxID=379 RepID=UPI00143826E5|nr:MULTISPECIES: hypothetical protein [Rhizobium]MBB4420707.1 hypothetical protein [Rhizobium leguminosarum]
MRHPGKALHALTLGHTKLSMICKLGTNFIDSAKVFSTRIGLFKTNLTERPPMTNDMMSVRSSDFAE